jgi:signal transduction histidine kinase
MDKEEMKHIRSPFRQWDSSKSQDQWLGLGWAIIKKYADYRWRKIQIKSTLWKWTSIYIKR